MKYVLLDVFAERPLEGNPLAVFTSGEAVPPELMQPLAREELVALRRGRRGRRCDRSGAAR